MPIVKVCKKCGRKGGYGRDGNTGICARCEAPKRKKDGEKDEEEE